MNTPTYTQTTVKIKRVDQSLPLPKYETNGSVGFDFIAREDMIIPSRKIARIPANVIVQVPQGYALIIAPRSSTPVKKGLLFPHSMGVIDQDYCGENDEILIQVYNFTDSDVSVERGERIAQGLFIKCDQLQWEEVDTMSEQSRGGFGSTGH